MQNENTPAPVDAAAESSAQAEPSAAPVADAPESHLSKAIKERDKAKQSARQAAAEIDSLRMRLAQLEPTINAVATVRLEGILNTCVDPSHHKAARAVLRDVDVLLEDEHTIRTLLHEHGLVRTRNAGSPGTPGINLGTKRAGEIPDATADTARTYSAREEQVRELARRYSQGDSFRPPPTRAQAETLRNNEKTADLVRRLNAKARGE